MRVIFTILLIIFLSITTLFSIAIININKTPGNEETYSQEIIETNEDHKITIPDSRVETLNDTQKFFVTNLENMFRDSDETETGTEPEDASDKTESVNNNDDDSYVAQTQNEEEETSQTQPGDSESNQTEEQEEEGEEEEGEEIEENTMKFFLDGDMENGIYLGKTTADLESTGASQQYGEDFLNTGFEFTVKNDDSLNLLPGSKHYLYIYFYGAESGWDYKREEINLSGEETTNKKITIFIDKPEEKTITANLQLIKGWAVDLRNNENPGLKNIEIYLDGPSGYGKFIGNVQYGIPRQDVADFFENQNYLNSGYQFEKSINLEAGSTHTLFIYALSSEDNSFNYETREIYLSGIKEEKAIINTQINTQKFNQDNTIEITGWAIDKKELEEYLKEKQEAEKEASKGEFTIKKLIFNSNRDGNENIYSINIDGTELTRLTDNPGSDLYPEVSPDNEKIAYTADIGGVWQIMVMDWDGSNKRQITNNNFRSAYPSWSYDSAYIYFEAYIDGDWELFRIKSDGTEQKRLTFNPSSHDWHPNGHPHQYAIIYESGASGHENIYVMNHDGTSIRKIVGDGPRRRAPDVSSDGSKITYMRYSGKNSDIWIMDYNGNNETRLTDNSDEDGHPAFSPDDQYIVYEEKKGSREDLILIDLTTGQKTNVTNSRYVDKDGSFLYHQ